MSVTFVTAFFKPTRHYRNVETYFALFDQLASSGVPILLYLDEAYIDRTFPLNVSILPTRLDTSWLPSNPVLPSQRNPEKDTPEYFCIQLSKLRYLADAVQHVETPFLAWIDFGVFHMFRQPNVSKLLLRTIAQSEWPRHRILSPGCRRIEVSWDYPVWWFCGSFLLGHRDLWRPAYQRQTEIVREHLPRLTWEVNVWTHMADLFVIYQANHNDTLLMRAMQLVQRHPGVETCSKTPANIQASTTD